MAVRVKLRISLGDKIVSASALVNSGYEADTPQLMIPIALAKHLGLRKMQRKTYLTQLVVLLAFGYAEMQLMSL